MTQNFKALDTLMSDKVEAVIFDWAGTLVDFSSLAPTQIFVDAFATFGIQISLEQARGPRYCCVKSKPCVRIDAEWDDGRCSCEPIWGPRW